MLWGIPAVAYGNLTDRISMSQVAQYHFNHVNMLPHRKASFHLNLVDNPFYYDDLDLFVVLCYKCHIYLFGIKFYICCADAFGFSQSPVEWQWTLSCSVKYWLLFNLRIYRSSLYKLLSVEFLHCCRYPAMGFIKSYFTSNFSKGTAVDWRFTDDGKQVRVSRRTGRILPLSAIVADETEDFVKKSAYKGKYSESTKLHTG